ncbi:sensor histidine kinase [Sphingomonas crocodyli]|uniref:histidine kinase n=1 Tax=Sphingomonas crocodyli TaxID=1979270 RepID=A0A437LZW9_9SPHN|nr:HAMP domain-containing sensor histidine kinase [Sphingomonas crocodyli]RVT90915.1 HAMP domain-containing histidine kinase [Sphingomonas crocodyli]
METSRQYPDLTLDPIRMGLTVVQQLVDSLAVEVKRPLATIVTSAQAGMLWLERPDLDGQRLNRLVDTILRSASQATAMIERYRSVTDIREAVPGLFDMNDIVREAVLDLTQDVSANRVGVIEFLAPDLPHVRGYDRHFRLILSNLLANSIQALATSETKQRRIEVATQVDSAGVSVEVRDNGGGFGGHHGFAFEALYSTKPAALGMGLTICRTILTIYGGTIEAGDNADGGGWVRFTIPAYVAVQAASEAA